ncbi:hypothetical protein [Flavobacterium aquidurense]|uniref:Uncharacterized protein n=1 Tax=Flavobacterium aquidurense TaxID=362413 RepID=A0A0Q0RV19_9FLAO|nr:hypothetical protein [Flavobacterium aquidurense]KQB40914.1 hypothetical protein RC62_4288 [Flavobacterium aquidurense]
MIKKLNRLAHPVFLVSLFILFLNDLILKTVFHNNLTGKLSDFSGLLAFPFFWTVLFPKRSKEIHIAVALFFVFWKSPFSEAFVNFFGLYRVVDFSDNMALVSILVSFWLLKQQSVLYKVQPVFLKLIFLLSCFSFVATSKPQEPETFEDGFSYLHLNNETDKKITLLINFKFSENEIATYKNQQIKILIDNYKRFINQDEKEHRSVFKPSDSLQIVKEVNDEWLLRQKYSIIRSIILDKGDEQYVVLPLHGNDISIGFPKDFKISILVDNNKLLKSYDKKAFFSKTENKKLNEFSRREMFNLTFGKKKEPLNIADSYGKWESDKKVDFNKIEINSNYFINDRNGEVYDCNYNNDTILVHSPNKIYLGIIKKATKDRLVISWDNEPDLTYVRSKKPPVLGR